MYFYMEDVLFHKSYLYCQYITIYSSKTLNLNIVAPLFSSFTLRDGPKIVTHICTQISKDEYNSGIVMLSLSVTDICYSEIW